MTLPRYCKRGAVCRSLFEIKEKKPGNCMLLIPAIHIPYLGYDNMRFDKKRREKKSLSLSAASPLIIESSSFSAGGPSNEQDIPFPFFFLPLVIRETEFDFHFFLKKRIPPRHPKFVRLRTYVRMNTSIIIFDQITPFFP